MKYDVERIKECDIEDIAETLGLQTKKIGRRISVLCPKHNDEHFGSCLLDRKRNRFHCFACGADGDCISFVQIVQNYSFTEACEYLSDIYGIPKSEDNKFFTPKKRILSDDLLELIGLCPRPKSKIMSVKRITDGFVSYEDLSKNQRTEWQPLFVDSEQSGLLQNQNSVDDKPDGYTVIFDVIDRNPLQTLLDTDENAYRNLIYNKTIEAIEKYREMIEMVKNPAKFYSEKVQHFLKAVYCNDIAKTVGIEHWIEFMNERIRKCDNLRIEFAPTADRKPDTLKSNSENNESHKRNVFGRISEKGVLI